MRIYYMLYCFNSTFCSLVLYSHIKCFLSSNMHLSMKTILVDPNLVYIFDNNGEYH